MYRRAHGIPFSRRRGAFTLVEVLAVIAIISLVAGVATVGLASSSEETRLREAAARMRELDAHARLFARAEEPVIMTASLDRREVRLHLVSSGDAVRRLGLGRGIALEIAAGEAEASVVFDRRGRSADYEVTVSMADRSVRLRVAGLTGLARDVAGEVEP